MKTRFIARPATKASPFVKALHLNLISEGKTLLWLAERSGVARRTLSRWWAGEAPHIDLLICALNAVGLSLKVAWLQEEEKPRTHKRALRYQRKARKS